MSEEMDFRFSTSLNYSDISADQIEQINNPLLKKIVRNMGVQAVPCPCDTEFGDFGDFPDNS